MATRCRCPPESSCGRRSRKAAPGRSSAASIAATACRLILLPIADSMDDERLHDGVGPRKARVERGEGSWKIICTARRKRFEALCRRDERGRRRETGSVRRSGRSPRTTRLASVLLPLPLSPTMPRARPGARAKETPSTAATTRPRAAKSLRTFLEVKAAQAMARHVSGNTAMPARSGASAARWDRRRRCRRRTGAALGAVVRQTSSAKGQRGAKAQPGRRRRQGRRRPWEC